MYFGQFYIDWYTGPQFAMMLGAAVSLVFGSSLVLVASLRAVLKGWFASAIALSATAAFIPLATLLTLIVGPYIEQWLNWLIYQSAWVAATPYSYGYSYGGYSSSLPWRPDLLLLYHPVSVGHSLAMGGAAVALGLMGVSANLLIPFGRGGGLLRDVDDAESLD